MQKIKSLSFLLIKVVLELALVYYVIQETGIFTGIFCVVMIIACEIGFFLLGRAGFKLKTIEDFLRNRRKTLETKKVPTLEDLPLVEFSEDQFILNEVAMAQQMDAGNLAVVPGLLNSRCLDKSYDFGALSMNDLDPFMRKMVDAVNRGAKNREEGELMKYPEEFPDALDFQEIHEDDEDDEDDDYGFPKDESIN